MRFTKVLYFTAPSSPPGQAIVVLKGEDGWLYLKPWLEEEGPLTPFSSVQELEVALGEKLTLEKEMDITS